MPQNLIDDKSTLVQLMTWCHQAGIGPLGQNIEIHLKIPPNKHVKQE